jgi:hypothetical protein
LPNVGVLIWAALLLWIRGLRLPVTTAASATGGFGLLMGGAMRAVLTESMRLAGLMGFVVRSTEGFGLLTFLAWRAPLSFLFGATGFAVLFPLVLDRGPIGLLALKELEARLAALAFPAAGLEALKVVPRLSIEGRAEFPLQDRRTLGLLVLLGFPRLCQFVRPIIGLDLAGCERWTTFVRCAVAGLVFLTCLLLALPRRGALFFWPPFLAKTGSTSNSKNIPITTRAILNVFWLVGANMISLLPLTVFSGLRFDLTVCLARPVSQKTHQLTDFYIC